MHLPIRCQSHTLARQIEAERVMKRFELIVRVPKIVRFDLE